MRDAAEWSGVKCSGDIVLPKIPEVYLSVFISTCVFVCVCVCVCLSCVFLLASNNLDSVLLLRVC